MSADLTLQFQYTEAEYVAAVRSFYNRKFHIPTYAVGVGIVLLAGFLFWLYSREPVILFGWSVFALIVLTPLIFYVITPHTHFRREANFCDTYWLRFSEEGLEFKTTHVNSQLDWQLYRQVWENRQFYLLFYGERLFTVIPKRVFADAAQETQFRELLQRKISSQFHEF
ncbi:MAG: YcxB family protein [Anaerolineae bacterium]